MELKLEKSEKLRVTYDPEIIYGEMKNVPLNASKLFVIDTHIITKNKIKSKIYNLARDHYLKHLIITNKINDICPFWGTIKVKIRKRDISFINKNDYYKGIIINLHEDYYDYHMNTVIKDEIMKNEAMGHDMPNNKTIMDTMIRNEVAKNDIWVIFANNHIGGNYKTDGWSQEEIATIEFYEMVMGITRYETTNNNIMNIDEAFLWFNLHKNSKVDHTDKHHTETANNEIVNFLSIDAPPRENRNEPYTLQELQHLFIKALTGFESAVHYGYNTIHSGNWGTGAFNNKYSIILMVQVLCAWMSKATELHYWGYKDVNSDPLFTKIYELSKTYSNGNKSIREAYAELATLLGIRYTLDKILEPILVISNDIWYLYDDEGCLIPYDTDIQSSLNMQSITLIFNEFGIEKFYLNIVINRNIYKIYYILGIGWVQINIKNSKKMRKVVPPMYVRDYVGH